MAGEWMKMELATPDKPEVLRMARLLNVDKDLVLGKLIRLWAWFDKNTIDGNVDGIVDADVDGIVGMDGFCNALTSVNWMSYDGSTGSLSLPNYDRHNGENAKKRALKNERQARWRNGLNEVDTHMSTHASTREEKRREEKNIKPKSKDLSIPTETTSKATRLPKDWVLPKTWGDWALSERHDLTANDILVIAATFKDYWIANASRATGKKDDWFATWRNWIRKQSNKPITKTTDAWWTSEASILAKGKELGIYPKPGETMSDFKGRINVKLGESR